MKTAALAFLTTMVHVSPSWACYNAVALSQDEMMQRLQLVEFHLANAQNWQASWFMGDAEDFHASAEMVRRAEDDQALLRMRFEGDWGFGAGYFSDKIERGPQYKAWFAEAMAHAGNPTLARHLLRELAAADLMPDAFAWAALAEVTIGDEGLDAVKTCHRRATVKAYVCPGLPKY